MNKLLRAFRMKLLWFLALSGLAWTSVAQPPTIQGPDQIETLRLTSRVFREASAKAEKVLVTIESFGGVSAIAGKIGGIRKQGEGNTTGVMISPDGYIVTSTFSFIQRPPVITVITSDGKRHFAELLGQDNTRKICLLKINDVQDMPVLENVDPEQITVGQWAISMGVGFGDSNPAISSGIISAKNRVGGKAIQTDANISPACYGGPLIDVQGRLLGICVPLNPQSQAIGAGVEWYDSGIGFAIPLYGLDDVLERLKKGDRVEPAFLGVQAAGDEKGKGILIQQVSPKSAAEVAGLKVGDRIIQVDGQDVFDLAKLKQILSRYEAGKELAVVYETADTSESKTISIVLGTPPVDPAQSQLEPPVIR